MRNQGGKETYAVFRANDINEAKSMMNQWADKGYHFVSMVPVVGEMVYIVMELNNVVSDE